MSTVIREGSDIGSHHDQLTVREVNDVYYAEDYHQAQGREQQERNVVNVLVKQAYDITQTHQQTFTLEECPRILFVARNLREAVSPEPSLVTCFLFS